MAIVPNDHLGPWYHGAPVPFDAWRIPAPVSGTLREFDVPHSAVFLTTERTFAHVAGSHVATSRLQTLDGVMQPIHRADHRSNLQSALARTELGRRSAWAQASANVWLSQGLFEGRALRFAPADDRAHREVLAEFVEQVKSTLVRAVSTGVVTNEVTHDQLTLAASHNLTRAWIEAVLSAVELCGFRALMAHEWDGRSQRGIPWLAVRDTSMLSPPSWSA